MHLFFPVPRALWAVIAALSFHVLAATPLSAEISPAAYSHMQNTAAERLVVHVSKVTVTPLPNNRTSVVAEGTVKEVKKSISGLKEGDPVTIKYDIVPLPKGSVGPSPIPPLQEGKDYPAYLTKEKDFFVPAARAYSFTRVGEPLTLPEPPPATNAPAAEPKKPKKNPPQKGVGAAREKKENPKKDPLP
ncbi:hypothetical protein DB346_06170 [Verrucomicrobia bacterium LW23]|nr:hypothetical protein DB346_06170 [Verrucomicrobia bacterium LW23]